MRHTYILTYPDTTTRRAALPIDPEATEPRAMQPYVSEGWEVIDIEIVTQLAVYSEPDSEGNQTLVTPEVKHPAAWSAIICKEPQQALADAVNLMVAYTTNSQGQITEMTAVNLTAEQIGNIADVRPRGLAGQDDLLEKLQQVA